MFVNYYIMVVSILMLTTIIILTIGKSSIRLFDRLNMSFSFALTMQFFFVALSVLPHVRVGLEIYIYNLMAFIILCIFTFLYYIKIARLISSIRIFLLTAVTSTILVLATVLLIKYDIDYITVSFVITLLSIGINFAIINDCKMALLNNLMSYIVLFIALIFFYRKPDYYIGSLAIIIFNSLVPSLFYNMILFNLFKRKRQLEDYVKNT